MCVIEFASMCRIRPRLLALIEFLVSESIGNQQTEYINSLEAISKTARALWCGWVRVSINDCAVFAVFGGGVSSWLKDTTRWPREREREGHTQSVGLFSRHNIAMHYARFDSLVVLRFIISARLGLLCLRTCAR